MSANKIAMIPVMFSTEEIKKINKEIQTKYITDQSIENSEKSAGWATKKAKVHHIPCPPLMEYLHPFITEIQKANMDCFGYDLFFYFTCAMFNYNVYDGETKDEYGWHTDGTQDGAPTDIKLTCILNLSEDTYEGGDLVIFPNYQDTKKEEYKNLVGKFRTPGTAIIFNSFMPHKVLPVTKGKRITLTYWVEGPTWK